MANGGVGRAGRHSTTALRAVASLLALNVGTSSIRPADHAATQTYFVTPSGSPAGDGSAAAPWDLASALAGYHGRIQPGDTIWMRGGTYRGDFRSSLRGTATAPIVVRQLRGERAVVDGRINAYGVYTVFWGFEITQSAGRGSSQRGIDVRGAGHRFVNLTIHDVGGSGIGFWMEGADAEVYGCIIYNNGSRSSLDHGIYAINRDGRKSISDNVVFNNFAYGIHVYGKPTQALKHFTIDGNVVFGNGSISAADRAKPNLLVGGDAIPAEDVAVADNLFFAAAGARVPNVQLGYDPSVLNSGLRLVANTVVGGDPALRMARWDDAVVRGNLFLGSGAIVDRPSDSMRRVSWIANSEMPVPAHPGTRRETGGLTAAAAAMTTAVSAGATVIVRPNRYERGRAVIAVINWAGSSDVTADVSSVLGTGDRYELRNIEKLFDAPLSAGRYAGGGLTIPMRAVAAPAPTGLSVSPPPTGPFFDVFLLRKVP